MVSDSGLSTDRLEGAHSVGIDAVFSPYPLHRRGADPDLLRHRAAAPVGRSPGGRRVHGEMNDLGHLVGGDGTRPFAAGAHPAQTLDALGSESPTPLDDRYPSHAKLLGDGVVGVAVGCTQTMRARVLTPCGVLWARLQVSSLRRCSAKISRGAADDHMAKAIPQIPGIVYL